jgi:hypothetical protein
MNRKLDSKKHRFFGRVARFALLVVVIAFFAGCVKNKSKDKQQKASTKDLSAYVIDSAPADLEAVNINYDDKITLLGYKLDTPKEGAKPGDKVNFTLYWKVNKAIGEKGWNLFTHILADSGERLLNIDNVGPIRSWEKDKQALSPSDWKEGKVYVDKQSFRIPKKAKGESLEISVGIWKDKKRLAIKSGPKLPDDRGLVAKIPLSGGEKKRPSTRVPELRADKLDKAVKLKIDGKLDEEAWKTAAVAGPFVNVRTGEPDTKFPVQGSAKLLWNDDNLFIGFEVTDPDIVGDFPKDKPDPQLWTKDTVEIMIDPDGDGDNKDYYEIQVNPQNLVFDSQFDAYNLPKGAKNAPYAKHKCTPKNEVPLTNKGRLVNTYDKKKAYYYMNPNP